MEGLKLQTPVETGRSKVGVSLNDKIVILGSCFADNMGQKMVDLGFDVCLNPFGTLYNPVSVCNSVARLTSGIPFSKDECVQMGAGAGLVCSFSHHTSFARRTEDEFLACTGYPECKNTKAIVQTIDVKCPDCGGDIVVKRGKSGKVFYGCSNYPDCKKAFWYKPTNQKCPQCGSLLLERKTKSSQLACSNDQCGYKE